MTNLLKHQFKNQLRQNNLLHKLVYHLNYIMKWAIPGKEWIKWERARRRYISTPIYLHSQSNAVLKITYYIYIVLHNKFTDIYVAEFDDRAMWPRLCALSSTSTVSNRYLRRTDLPINTIQIQNAFISYSSWVFNF